MNDQHHTLLEVTDLHTVVYLNACVVCGPLTVGSSFAGGRPIGQPMQVTKSNGNLIQFIDNESAVAQKAVCREKS